MKKFFDGLFSLIGKLIFIGVLVIVLATLGEYYLAKPGDEDRALRQRWVEPEKVEKPVVLPPAPIAWEEIDEEIAVAVQNARVSAETFADGQLADWVDRLMVRVDNDFLEWYFDYWNQQRLGLMGLYNTVLHNIDEANPTAAEAMTEEVQIEFAKRVLHPKIAQLELEQLTRQVVNVFVDTLRLTLDTIPERYEVPRPQWFRHLDGIAVLTSDTEANRNVPLTLKALTASSVGGAMIMAKPLKMSFAKIGSKVSANLAAKSTAKIAAKTGEKVAGKTGGKLLGPIIGIGIIVWDAIDHENMKKESRPVLRENIRAYLDEVRNSLLYDMETGVGSVIYKAEGEILRSLQNPQRSDVSSR